MATSSTLPLSLLLGAGLAFGCSSESSTQGPSEAAGGSTASVGGASDGAGDMIRQFSLMLEIIFDGLSRDNKS